MYKIVLPSREMMLPRLIEVSDDRYMVEHLYPFLLKQAGKTRVPVGVIVMLDTAIATFMEDLPLIVQNGAIKLIPKFVDALVEDRKAALEAKNFYNEVYKDIAV